jgi:hypothetical protein
MTDQHWQTFSEHVSVEDRLRVAVVKPGDEPDVAAPARLVERNLATLASVAALEDRRAEGDDDNPVMQELARLDAKLNALVDIVSRAILPVGGLPSRQPVRFNAIGILLPAVLLPPGEDVCVRLHLDACPGLPLVLPAKVERRLDDGHAFLAFQPTSDVLAEALERLVFRHHRRRVAEARQSLT